MGDLVTWLWLAVTIGGSALFWLSEDNGPGELWGAWLVGIGLAALLSKIYYESKFDLLSQRPPYFSDEE
jgi:hypothetical protein